MTNPTTTTPVPGTDLSVSYNPDAYAGAPVYLHETDQPWFKGEVIGSLGGMVGHGVYASLGPVETWGNVLGENVRASFTGHMTRETAAVAMATTHLALEPSEDFVAQVKWMRRES